MQRLVVAVIGLGFVIGGAPGVVAEGGIEHGSGTLVTKQLTLQDFTEIEVPGFWEVEVTRGPYAVRVTVHDNVLDDLRVERRGSALRLGVRPGVFRRLTLRAQVSMPQLVAIQVSGNGRVAVTAFAAPALRIGVSGSGTVHGSHCQVGALEVEVSGSGDVDLNGCTVEATTVSISGSGSVLLRAAARRQPRSRPAAAACRRPPR